MNRTFSWDGFSLDLDAFRLERRGEVLPLEPKALDLLALLVQRPGHLFTKAEIFEAVWPDTAVTDHALTRVVAQLRRVLDDDSRQPRYIETVPTRGYRWVCSLEDPEAATVPIAGRLPEPPPPIERRGSTRSLAAILGTLAAALSALALAAAWDRGITSASAPIPWPVQVTTHAGLDINPALSPRGDRLAFSSDRSGALELYVRASTGAIRDVALTSDGGHNVQPAWSPDGSSIAYHSSARGGIWVVDAGGGPSRRVVAEGSSPAWAPDGRSIVYQSDERVDVTPSAFGAQVGSTLWIVGADGSNPRQLTVTGSPKGGHASPAWTPDGRFVGFAVFEGADDDGLWLVEVETARTSRLMSGHRLFELAFAPDGSAVYVAGGEALIRRLPFDAARGVVTGPSEPIPVAGVPSVRGLSMARDGSRLLFAGLALSSQIWAQPISPDGAPAGEPRPLTMDTSRRNSMAVVSPDGTRIAYMSSRRGEMSNVWLMDIDGGNRMQATGDESFQNKPGWFPDGRRLGYLASRGGIPGFWSFDTVTGRRERLASVDVDAFQFAATYRFAEMELSPSMRRLAFTVRSAPTGGRRLFVTPLDAFSPRELGDGSQSMGYPAWSPDERHVAVEIKDGAAIQAAIVDVATGQVRLLTSGRGQTWVRSWSPDGRRIAVAELRHGTWSLRWIDVRSGAAGTMLAAAPPNVYVRYPEWSRLNDVVVFERGELTGNIWSLPLGGATGTY